MSWLDIILIIVLIFSVIGGVKNGLIKSVLSLAGLIVGVVLAGHFYVSLAEKLTFIPENIAKIVAFLIILGIVMIIAAIIGSLLTKVISAIMLGWANRIGGAVFGLVMGALWCAALLALWVKFVGTASVITESAIASLLLERFPMILALLPDEFDVIRQFFQGGRTN